MEKLKDYAALIGAVLLGVSIPAGGIWWMSSHVAFANDQALKQGKMEIVVEKLAEFRIHDETVKQTEREMLRKLCAAGKLEGADCVGVDE